MSRFFFVCFVGLLTLSSFPSAADQASLARYEFAEIHMGTLFRLVLFTENQEKAVEASGKVFRRIRELDAILSDYKTDSELSRVSREAGSQPRVVSPDLYRVLNTALGISRLSKGALDVSVKPLTRLWKDSYKLGKLPSMSAIQEAMRRVGHDSILLNSRTRSVRLLKESMQLDLGALAKGYAADQALEKLYEFGVEKALIDAGGDIRVGEPPPDRSFWRIAVGSDSSQQRPLMLRNSAVASSSDKYQHLEIDGIRYSHVLDPRTGLGVTHGGMATVIAPEAMTADALATALSVLSPEEGLNLLKKFPGVSARIERKKNDRTKTFRSPGFPP